jgi:hypothetical protein
MSNNLDGLSLKDYRSDAGLDKWFAALSIPAAPLRRAGLKVSLEFFNLYLPTLRPQDALSLIVAMDLSKPVRNTTIAIGETIIAARADTEAVSGPRKLFFTRPGRAMQNSGINDAHRHFVSFKARISFSALESFTAPAIDTWSRTAPGQRLSVAPRSNSLGVLVNGGNTQLVIPNSQVCLTIERFGQR